MTEITKLYKQMNIDEMALMFNNGRICPDDFFDTSVLDCKDFNNDCVYCIKQWLQEESEA